MIKVKLVRYTTDLLERAEAEINDWIVRNEVDVMSISCTKGDQFSIPKRETELIFTILYREKEDQ